MHTCPPPSLESHHAVIRLPICLTPTSLVRGNLSHIGHVRKEHRVLTQATWAYTVSTLS